MGDVVVTQEDERAVAEFHKQSFKALLDTTDAEIDAGINRAHRLLCEAFARHRIAARKQALEEAAKVICTEADELEKYAGMFSPLGMHRIADRLRAIGDKE